ncbi:MAG: hypothetical protein JSW07_11160 [bacterium]|nr:MAG: hypothetical protein JSW07_11160 [bacterium]
MKRIRHYNMKKIDNNFPDCLSNTKDLNLGRVYSKYRDIPNIPELTTIYEIERPIIVALNSLNSTVTEINPSLSEILIQGLFVLGVSHLEVLLSDLLKRLVLLHPESIGVLYRKNEKTDDLKYEVSIDDLKNGIILENLIEKRIDKFCYNNIETILKKLSEVLKFELKVNIDKIVEIKESRNLLLHNNLIVNDYYLNRTKSIKRAERKNEKITLDAEYVKNSIEYIIVIVTTIRKAIYKKYKDYTILALLKRLWDFTFAGSGIPTLIEDFWTLNHEKDIIDGPVKPPREYFASSEKFFFEVWRAQRTGKSVTNFSMVHLDSENIKKLSFLVEVFGNLRFPYW